MIGKTIMFSMYLWIYVKRLENRTPIVYINCYWVLQTCYYKKNKLRKELINLQAKLKGKRQSSEIQKPYRVRKGTCLFTFKY